MVAGDHGESLGEHGESTHGLFVYEARAARAARSSRARASPPAVVERAGAPDRRRADIGATSPGSPRLAGVEGRSLRPLMSGQAAGEDPPPVYAETYFPQFFMGWAPLRSMRAGRWKYIDAPEPELYDLSTDAGEQHERLREQSPPPPASLRRALTVDGRSPARDRMTPTPLSDQARERLASLGYVSAVTPPHGDDAGAGGPDPKHMVALFEQLLDGNRALAERTARCRRAHRA